MTKIKNSTYNISKADEETIDRLQQELRSAYNRMNEHDVSVNELNKLRMDAANIRNKLSKLGLNSIKVRIYQ